MISGEEYNKAYDEGYDAGADAAYEDGRKEGYAEALYDHGLSTDSCVDNLCLKCDCRDYGFECVLNNPRQYMEDKLTHGKMDNEPKRKKFTNPDYDRAMEIFHPK